MVRRLDNHIGRMRRADDVPMKVFSLVASSSSASLLAAGALGFLTFTQCGQRPERYGEALAGDGRHGSIMPSPGRVRSRNDMRA
jgi:hypothetical protein